MGRVVARARIGALVAAAARSARRAATSTGALELRSRARAHRHALIDRQLAVAPVEGRCAVCDGPGNWTVRPVINGVLAAQWRLRSGERAVIDVQQGHTCTDCGTNLRGRALARALSSVLGHPGPLGASLSARPGLRVLEVNPAGGLTEHLAAAARHVCTAYPDVDMQRLPFEDDSFDVVVHSDTLEHVPDALLGIRECLRVAGAGWVVFTTPVLASRLSRTRGRYSSRSYHGGDAGRSLVHHEFGADIWEMLARAGATEIRFHLDQHPYAAAISCRRERATVAARGA
jgi:SAM-dependent methyltransferase